MTAPGGSDGVGVPDPAVQDGASVGVRAAMGVLWMTAQKWLARVGGLVTIAVLTRLVAPEDFGLIAAASSVMVLTYTLSDVGFSTYIVQAATVDRAQLSTAFWFSIVSGLTLCGAIVAAAPLFAAMFGLPELVGILRVMATSVVLVALASVPLALLRRRMAFRQLATQEIAAAVTAQVVAIAAAALGAGVWALVLQLLTAQLVTLLVVWRLARWVPARAFVASEFWLMTRFGAQVVGHGMVGVVRTWAETAIIATGLGVRELGYWNIAQRLVQTVSDLSGSALFPVSTVAFAKSRSSLDGLRAAYRRAAAMAQAVVTPVMAGVAVSAPVLVPLAFGAEWTPSAGVATPLAVAAILTFTVALDHGLHYGVGRPGRWLVFTLGVYGLSVLVTSLAVRHGLVAVAAAFVGTALVETVGRWFMVARLLGTGVRESARPFGLVALPVLLAAAAGVGVHRLLADAAAPLVLVAIGLAMAVVYAACLRWSAPATWDELRSLAGALWARRRGAPARRRAVAGTG